jgi:hypothetical protein
MTYANFLLCSNFTYLFPVSLPADDLVSSSWKAEGRGSAYSMGYCLLADCTVF